MFDIGGKVEGFIRNIIWGIIKTLLWGVDTIWDVVIRIARIDFYNKGSISSWFAVAGVFLILFITYRVVKIYFYFMLNDGYRQKVQPIRTVMMIGVTSLILSLAPIGMQYVNSVSIDLINGIGMFLPTDVQTVKVSDVLMETNHLMGNKKFNEYTRSTDEKISQLEKEVSRLEASNEKGRLSSFEQVDLVNKKRSLNEARKEKSDGYSYDSSTFDINRQADDEYLFFPNWASLFLMIIISVLAAVNFVGLAISMTQRLLTIIMLYLIAPYTISSLIEPTGEGQGEYHQWVSTIIGSYIILFLQIWFTYLILYLATNQSITAALGDGTVGTLGKLFLVIGGFAAIKSAPITLSRFFGGQGMGISEGLSEVSSGIRIGRVAGGIAGGVTSGAVSGAVGFGIGMAGGTRLGYQKAVAKDSGAVRKALGAVAGGIGGSVRSGAASLTKGGRASGGALGKGRQIWRTASSHPYDRAQETQGARTAMGSAGYDKGSGSSSTFNDPPTEKQLSAAQALHIEGAEKMSKGELSLALENAGAERSFFTSGQNTAIYMNGKRVDDRRNAKMGY